MLTLSQLTELLADMGVRDYPRDFDSLSAVELVLRINELCGVDLDPSVVTTKHAGLESLLDAIKGEA